MPGHERVLPSIVHALVLLLVVLFLGGPVGAIPLAALAGVLMVTACRMVDIHNVRAVLRSTGGDAFILVVTAATTVLFDLILAVEVGIAAGGPAGTASGGPLVVVHRGGGARRSPRRSRSGGVGRPIGRRPSSTSGS